MYNKLFNRDFTLVVIGQIISLLGNAILSFALPLHLLKLTGDGAIFGLVIGISIVPTILLSPIGGILADRANRKNIMVALDFFTCAVILVSSMFVKDFAVLCISATLIFLSVIRSFYQPAVQSSIPTISSEKNLLSANSIVNMISSVSMLLGPIIGGILYGFFGLTPIIYIGSIAFFLSAVMEIFIKMPHIKSPMAGGVFSTVKQDFSDSIKFIFHEKPFIVKALVIICMLNLFLSALITIGVPYIVNIVLSLSSELYGLVQSAMGFGSLAGGISVGVLASKIKARSLSLFLFAASLALIPIGVSILLNLPAMTIYGIIFVCSAVIMLCATMFSIVAITSVQKMTPPELLGKVMSFISTVSTCAMPVGTSIYGFLFEKATGQIPYIFFVTSAILITTVFASRKLWETAFADSSMPNPAIN